MTEPLLGGFNINASIIQEGGVGVAQVVGTDARGDVFSVTRPTLGKAVHVVAQFAHKGRIGAFEGLQGRKFIPGGIALKTQINDNQRGYGNNPDARFSFSADKGWPVVDPSDGLGDIQGVPLYVACMDGTRFTTAQAAKEHEQDDGGESVCLCDFKNGLYLFHT